MTRVHYQTPLLKWQFWIEGLILCKLSSLSICEIGLINNTFLGMFYLKKGHFEYNSPSHLSFSGQRDCCFCLVAYLHSKGLQLVGTTLSFTDKETEAQAGRGTHLPRVPEWPWTRLDWTSGIPEYQAPCRSPFLKPCPYLANAQFSPRLRQTPLSWLDLNLDILSFLFQWSFSIWSFI